ncbi:ankyrin repeat domain-containing protein [Rhodopirellula europaea]|nr:ankyrin repeat domain-containing protein [Rhodopirellula europaea]
MQIALGESVDRFEQEVQELSSAEGDAFDGRLEPLLRLCIQRGLLDSVKIAVAAGADVNRSVGSGSAPLHEAMFSMIPMPLQTRIVEALLQAGADPNETIAEGAKGGVSGGRSPLMAALNHRHPPMLKALLDAGADCNVTDRIGRNALHLLAHSPHFEESPAMAQLLIEAGCDVDNADNHGETVMHVAAMSAASYPDGIEHSLRFLRLILDQHPDLSLRDTHGYRALQSKRKHHVPQDFEKILASLRDHEVAKRWIDRKDQ